MSRVELTLVSKPGCHLCDDARVVISDVIREVADRDGAPEVVVTEVSILDDPALFDEHVEDIPVVLIDGRVHTFWRVDPDRLTAALLGVP